MLLVLDRETLSLELRTRIAEKLINGKGLAEEIISELVGGFGKQARLKARAEEGAEDVVDIELSNVGSELSSEVLEACMKGLEQDFGRGIVIIEENADLDSHKSAFESDPTAGTTWEAVKGRLLAGESVLLKKAATMQGKGELIGVFSNGELCIVDRSDENGNREPVITAFTSENKRITITTDTPKRDTLMNDITQAGRFADYWEVRQAAEEDGLTLPPDTKEYKKRGIVAAVEAVSGKPFVSSQNGRERRLAILECGNVSRETHTRTRPRVRVTVRVVGFNSDHEHSNVGEDFPGLQVGNRGAVRVLRG